ncbi:MAG: protoheme IX farnesyltransferase [Thermodesulfobacteriota bacterium]|nr:MAG: protoheme IX farnesyltransferase [Thermodesulfobacteriota bacterium]
MEQVEKAPSNIVVSTVLLSKPGIIVSVAFTGFAGMVVAAKGLPSLSLILLTMAALLLSAAGSAILNNVLDKQLDVLMDRLSKRAQALEVVGVRTAIFIASLFIVISLFISLSYLNYIAALLIIAAILSYTLLYTLYLKRSSPYGTILGGLPGALPVLIGYAAIQPNIGLDGYILFAFMMLWQPPHFWALAQKYKLDYKKAGVPVMPVAMGTKFTNIMILIYSISLLPLSLSFWFLGYASAYFAILAIIFGGYFEYVIIKSTVTNSGYGKAFATSIFYMLGIMAALILDLSFNSGNTFLIALSFH